MNGDDIAKKIIPVTTLCLSVAELLLALAAIITASVGVVVPQVFAVAAPVAIVALVSAMLLTPFAILFKKDILCRIAAFIDGGAFILSLVAVIIWAVVGL